MEVVSPGELAEDRAEGKSFPCCFYAHWPLFRVKGQLKRWEVYTLPTLLVDPLYWACISGTKRRAFGVLKPDAEQHWQNYCIAAAKTYNEDSS